MTRHSFRIRWGHGRPVACDAELRAVVCSGQLRVAPGSVQASSSRVRAWATAAVRLVTSSLARMCSVVRRADAKASGEVGGDLAVHGRRLVHDRAAPGGEGGQPGEPGGQAASRCSPAHGPGGHVPGAVQVDQVQVEPGNHLIVGEVPGQHRAAGAASGILDQRPVKDGLQVPGPARARAPSWTPTKAVLVPCSIRSAAARPEP